MRGAYIGAFASTGAVAFAIGCFAALQLRDASGDTAMWGFFALVSVAAALLGAWVCRLSVGRRAPVEPAPA